MHPVNLYPGDGQKLGAANNAGVRTDPETFTIPAGGYTETFSVNDCIDFGADIIGISGAPDADILVEKGTDAVFTQAVAHATVAITGKWTVSWNNDGAEHGNFFRFKNPGTKTVSITLQKRIL